MAINETEVRAEAQRVWPNAKRIEVSPGGFTKHRSPDASDVSGWHVTALDFDDQVIDQASAETLEKLMEKLKDMQPEGGQAP